MNAPRRILHLALVMLALVASAFRPAPPSPFPDFDKRPGPLPVSAARKEAAAAIQSTLPGVQVRLDPRTRSAAQVVAAHGFLTQPGKAEAQFSPDRITRDFLARHRALFAHGPEALDAARLKRDFVTAHNGLHTSVWEQHVHGIAVFEGMVVSHTTARQELVSLSSHFIPDSARLALSGKANASSPFFDAMTAVGRAAQSLSVTLGPKDLVVLEQLAVPSQRHRLRGNGLTGETTAELTWLQISPDEVRLCWDVVMKLRSRGEVFRVLVDAQTGAVWLRRCLTTYLDNASYRVFTSDSPTPLSPGHAVPLATQPAAATRKLISLSAWDTNASPAGWIDDGGNETRGNNVDAHLDHDGNDVPELPRPQGSPFRVFDFPLDLGLPPLLSSEAAVTQLFYWNNFMHDRLYELGFTEAAGNFQVDNFGRGGVGGDPVQADAQDGEGFNNANFFTPPDGQSPRMQMYLFPGPEPDRDGDFDAEVILHEYTHGLSNRRVGGGVGISALQSAGLGEGWSDFYALALLSQPADDVDGNYAAAAYISYFFLGLQESHYFGIRRFPYSTDMTKNPLTFRDIDPTQASAHQGVPRSPVFGGLSADEVHALGEVWCVALWDARANLIHKLGWTNGNLLMLQLVTDGMNLCPPNPDFLQARDAILLADEIKSGGANRPEIWGAFARRGMGAQATSPGNDTTVGVVESFELPDDLGIQPALGFSGSGPTGGPFSVSPTTFTLHNFGSNGVVWHAGTTANWLTIAPGGGFNATGANASAVVSLNTNATTLSAGVYQEMVRFTNMTSGRVQSRAFKLRIGQPDYFTELFQGACDLAWNSFTFTPDGSASFYSVCREVGTNFPTDPAGGTPLALADDAFTAITLDGTNRVLIYGHATNRLEVGSNGYLTFGAGDSDMTETLADHFSRRRVAGLFRDLHPGQGGSISWRQLEDRAAFTYQEIPEYNVGNTNSFQIELFFDGRIRLSYLKVEAGFGLAGLSQGLGLPAGFDESDFSSYAPCSRALSIATPPVLAEGDGRLANAGQILLRAARPTNLTVALTSSNTNKIIVPGVVEIPAGETNARFDILVIDNSLLDGTQDSLLLASAPGIEPGAQLVSVNDNEAAALQLNAPSLLMEGNGSTQAVVTVSAAVDASATVWLTSSDPSELIVPASVLIAAGQTSAVFNITIVNDTEIDGLQLATITAAVANWMPASAGIAVGDNESTQLALEFTTMQLQENAGVRPNGGAVILSGTLPTNLLVSLNSSDVTELFVVPTVNIPAGQQAATFNIATVDDLLLDGTQIVTVSASAPGFQAASSTVAVLDDESPPRLSIFQTSNTVVVAWTTISGLSYQLETKPDLNGAWTNASPEILATGINISVTNAVTPARRFYRVTVP